MDGVDAFHAGYVRGQVTRPPDEYTDMILIPAILHMRTVEFWALSPIVQEKTRRLLQRYIAAGWAGNTRTVKRSHAEL